MLKSKILVGHNLPSFSTSKRVHGVTCYRDFPDINVTDHQLGQRKKKVVMSWRKTVNSYLLIEDSAFKSRVTFHFIEWLKHGLISKRIYISIKFLIIFFILKSNSMSKYFFMDISENTPFMERDALVLAVKRHQNVSLIPEFWLRNNLEPRLKYKQKFRKSQR